MRIGIITHNFPVNESDRQNAGIFVFDLAKTLSKGLDVVVLAPGPEEKVVTISGIKTYFFKFPDKLGNLKIYNPSHLIKFGSFFIEGKRILKKFIEQNRDLDFIISMWAFPSGFFANSALESAGLPYAIYALGSDIYLYAKKPILKQLITKYLKNAKFLIADSPNLSKEVEKLSGKKTYFLPSVSNINFKVIKKTKSSKKINLTFLGRLEKVKGVDIFAEALLSLDSQLSKLIINMIGEGTLKDDLRFNFSNYTNVKFWGNLDAGKIAKILEETDWLVIPSRSDSIPLVFSEAMKFSVPVIASDLPDLKYLVNKYKVGYLFKKGDSNSLVKILKTITNRSKSNRIFKKNTKIAAGFFDLKKTSDKLQNLISRYV